MKTDSYMNFSETSLSSLYLSSAIFSSLASLNKKGGLCGRPLYPSLVQVRPSALSWTFGRSPRPNIPQLHPILRYQNRRQEPKNRTDKHRALCLPNTWGRNLLLLHLKSTNRNNQKNSKKNYSFPQCMNWREAIIYYLISEVIEDI